MYDKCYFCLDQLPKLKKESTASFFVNFGGAGVQKSRPTLLYFDHKVPGITARDCRHPSTSDFHAAHPNMSCVIQVSHIGHHFCHASFEIFEINIISSTSSDHVRSPGYVRDTCTRCVTSDFASDASCVKLYKKKNKRMAP